MGLFWDLMQQSQISSQSDRTGSLENRVQQLEMELANTRVLLKQLIVKLEENFGQDFDGDGRVG